MTQLHAHKRSIKRLQLENGILEGTKGVFQKFRWDLQPMRKLQGFKQTIFWKMFIAQDDLFLKFTNRIPQEMESWVGEERLGLSTGLEASDEVIMKPIIIVKYWFNNRKKA